MEAGSPGRHMAMELEEADPECHTGPEGEDSGHTELVPDKDLAAGVVGRRSHLRRSSLEMTCCFDGRIGDCVIVELGLDVDAIVNV